MNEIILGDMEQICSSEFIEWDMLKSKTILVTGATGLIGKNIINALDYASMKMNLDLKIIAVVRNLEKAEKLFAGLECISFIESDAEHFTGTEASIDYIIHGASPTASGYFVSHPVKTISTALLGTMNILRIARAKNVSGLVYLSSMEAYGYVGDERLLVEDDLGRIDPLSPRSSYPESKRMCEALCSAYAHEYGLAAKSIRLVMTFGPGIVSDDARVCAEFMRCVMDGRDIVLKTEGRAKRCYLYTADAVTAILAVMLKGEAGHSYNAANPETYCSVRDMAEMVSREISGGRIKVNISLNQDVSMYPAPGFLNLDITALQGLGWYPLVNLKDMYMRTIDYMG